MTDSSILKTLMDKEDWNKTAENLHPDNFDFGHAPLREHHEEAAKIVDGTHEHLGNSLDKIIESSVPEVIVPYVPPGASDPLIPAGLAD